MAINIKNAKRKLKYGVPNYVKSAENHPAVFEKERKQNNEVVIYGDKLANEHFKTFRK